MNKWNGKVKVFGPEVTYIFNVEAEISDELYARAIKFSEEGKPLSAEVYEELRTEIRSQFDLGDYLEYDQEKEPDEDDYDSEEEFDKAYDRYFERRNNYYDNYFVEDTWVVDLVDGDLIELNEKYVGKKVANGWESDEEETKCFYSELERCEDCSNTNINYIVDNHGILVEITEVSTETMESDGAGGGDYNENRPDYSAAEDFFDDLVSEFED